MTGKRLDDSKIKNLGDFGVPNPLDAKTEEIMEEDKLKAFDLDEISHKIRMIEYKLDKIMIILENLQTQSENIFQNTIKIEEINNFPCSRLELHDFPAINGNVKCKMCGESINQLLEAELLKKAIKKK